MEIVNSEPELMEYFIIQYFYWSDGCRMNHSFQKFYAEFYQLSEIKTVADRVTKNKKRWY